MQLVLPSQHQDTDAELRLYPLQKQDIDAQLQPVYPLQQQNMDAQLLPVLPLQQDIDVQMQRVLQLQHQDMDAQILPSQDQSRDAQIQPVVAEPMTSIGRQSFSEDSTVQKTVKVRSLYSPISTAFGAVKEETCPENTSSLSKKYSTQSSKLGKRPVSAKRDFPIGCGSSAPNMTIEEVYAARKEAMNRAKYCIINNHQKIQHPTAQRYVHKQRTPLTLNWGSKPATTSRVNSKLRFQIHLKLNKVAKKPKLALRTNRFESRLCSQFNHGSEEVSARAKVRKALSLFQFLCRTFVQNDESVSGTRRRVDFKAAKILRENHMDANPGKQIIGVVPGVEVGDQFRYRMELCLVGLHRQVQGGIDFVKPKGKPLATSIIVSGGYEDDLDDGEVLVYTGQGGNNYVGDKRQVTDQKLERGNLALVNSMNKKSPVRVIRGYKNNPSEKNKGGTLYTYDGLYDVERSWDEKGKSGYIVFKYQLRRHTGQPVLHLGNVQFLGRQKKEAEFKGIEIADISEGKERRCIKAVNEVDDENGPPKFIYRTKMIYPVTPLPHSGCSCTNGCFDRTKCACVRKNGGELPYNPDGELVWVKPLVYECGPDCSCPASCQNRVTQHGVRLNLEVFKTDNKGWGVRSRSPIASGTFVCEYTGTILNEDQVEECIGSDQYLFDIGGNSNTQTYWTDSLSMLVPNSKYGTDVGVVEDAGFTIDALKCGNVGRFINHSCSPNLYSVNVLYDHDDKRLPHVMLFAVENIPPMRELSYSYNYPIDQVYDSKGKIKQKECHCGSSECKGRMY